MYQRKFEITIFDIFIDEMGKWEINSILGITAACLQGNDIQRELY